MAVLRNKNPIQKISIEILKGLAVGSLIFAIIAFPGLALAFRQSSKHYSRYSRKDFRKSLWYLKKKRLIKISTSTRDSKIELTSEGKNRLLKDEYDHLSIKKPLAWDRKWHMVVFDVPERKKHYRNFLRMKLTDLGFYKLQKSFYIHPYPCEKEISLVGKFLDLEPSIITLVVEEKGIPQKVKEHFTKAGYLNF